MTIIQPDNILLVKNKDYCISYKSLHWSKHFILNIRNILNTRSNKNQKNNREV